MLITKDLKKKLETLRVSMYSEKGKELLNPIPYQPTGIRPKSMSLQAQIRRALRTELSLQANMQDMETFEESQDFDIDDPFESETFKSKYELLDEETLGEPEEKGLFNPALNTSAKVEGGDPGEAAPTEISQPAESGTSELENPAPE